MQQTVQLKRDKDRYALETTSVEVPTVRYAKISKENLLPYLIYLGISESQSLELVAKCDEHGTAMCNRTSQKPPS